MRQIILILVNSLASSAQAGECTGPNTVWLGQFEGFTFRQLRTMALYLILIDPGMLSEIEG